METLFNKYDLSSSLDGQPKKIREHVNRLDENYILGASEEDLVAYLKQEYSVEPPVLGEPFIADSAEVDMDVTNDPMRGGSPFGGRIIVQGMEVHVKVPLHGRRELVLVST